MENRRSHPIRRWAPMSWRLKGRYVETCSCDLICPCNASFDHGAVYDYCRVTLAFAIDDGEIEGTDVSGLNVVAVADTPKVMTDGNWKLGLFVDERASDEQMEKLVGVFGGQKGGPMEALAPLVGGMPGVERAARGALWRPSWRRCSGWREPRSRWSTTVSATASASATRSTSRSRTSSR